MYIAVFWFWKSTWSAKLPAGIGFTDPALMALYQSVIAFTPASLLMVVLVGCVGLSYIWPPYSYSIDRKVSREGPSAPVTPFPESASLPASVKNSSQVAGGLLMPLAVNMSRL